MLYVSYFLLGNTINNTNTNIIPISISEKNKSNKFSTIKSVLLKKNILDHVSANFNYSYYRDNDYILKSGSIKSSDYKYHIYLDNKEIISDNKTIWEYDKINKEVFVSDIKTKKENILGSIKHLIQLIDKNFKIIKSSKTNNQIIFNLEPIEKKNDKEKIQLDIKEIVIIYNETRRVITEVNIIQNTDDDYYKNNVIKITFTSYDQLTFDKKEIKEYFTFQTPKDVEIIDMR